MVSPILWAGGEDFNFNPLGYTINTTTTGAPATFGANTGTAIRSGYARYALSLAGSGNGAINAGWIRSTPTFASSTFWFSMRLSVTNSASFATNGGHFLRFYDATGVVRLRLSTTGLFGTSTLTVAKVDAAGSATTLVTSAGTFATNGPTVPDKVDVFINYAVSGTITVYANGTQVCTFAGDVTTNSITSLSGFDLSTPGINSSGAWNACFSEMIVSTRDTRNFNLVTQAATANGNAHAWTGGTASNVANNSASVGQANPQYSDTATQIQEYQITPAIPTGNFSVISVWQVAQATVGSSGPTKFEFMVRYGSTDYTSTPDTAPSAAWSTFSYAWDTNPNTSAPWLTTDLAASSTAFNYGLKSIT